MTVRRRNPPKPTPPVLDPRIVAAIRDGLTNSEIIDVYGVDYATVRTARRAYMAGAA